MLVPITNSIETPFLLTAMLYYRILFQLSLEVYKKVLFWVKVPCISGMGSCTYADACALNPYKTKPCPPPFTSRKIPCKCPLKAVSNNSEFHRQAKIFYLFDNWTWSRLSLCLNFFEIGPVVMERDKSYGDCSSNSSFIWMIILRVEISALT